MDYLLAYRTECQEWLIKHGWHRHDGDMWKRNDDLSQSFNWMYLVVHRFIGKMPRKNNVERKNTSYNKRKQPLKRSAVR